MYFFVTLSELQKNVYVSQQQQQDMDHSFSENANFVECLNPDLLSENHWMFMALLTRLKKGKTHINKLICILSFIYMLYFRRI